MKILHHFKIIFIGKDFGLIGKLDIFQAAFENYFE
jgi:hypothetical protein